MQAALTNQIYKESGLESVCINFSEDFPLVVKGHYLNGTVNTILYDLTMSTGELLHSPFVSTQPIRVRSGDSVQLDPSGNPTIQEYETDVGLYSADQDIDGGSF